MRSDNVKPRELVRPSLSGAASVGGVGRVPSEIDRISVVAEKLSAQLIASISVFKNRCAVGREGM